MLARLSTLGLLKVCILVYQSPLHNIHDDISLANVDQHIVLQNLSKMQKVCH